MIRVPEWIEDRFGNCYLYFADHKGSYIRVAYSDHPTGVADSLLEGAGFEPSVPLRSTKLPRLPGALFPGFILPRG